MPRKEAGAFDQELLNLYDRYAHNLISRREFFEKAGKFAVSGVTAAALLKTLSPQYALANQVAPDDSRIKTEYIEYASPKGYGKVRGYLARPARAPGKLPAVVVVHENRGLNPYIEDVARRLAVAGFMALAPDGLTSLGGYPGNDDAGRQMQSKLDGKKLLEDFIAAFEALKARPESNGRVGVVGFCYGGGVANAMAVRLSGGGAVLWRSADGGRSGENKSAAAIALRGVGRAYQQRLAGVRGGAEEKRQAIHRVRLPQGEPWIPQRHHAALRKIRRRTRLVANHRILQR